MWHYYKDNSKLREIIAERMQNGDILISREVIAEIRLGGDELKNWVRENASAIVETDEEIQAEFTRLVNQYPGWVDPNSPKNLVDPYVIAVAIIHEGVVVTQEKQRKG